MQIIKHDTTAQLNASWYGKKTIKGSTYKKKTRKAYNPFK